MRLRAIRFTPLLFALMFAAPAEAVDGLGYTIERIEVRGNDKTKDEIILRALTFQPGESLTERAVDASRDALIRTRLFKTVHLASKPGEARGTAVVVVYVDEKRFGDLGVSGEYTELDGFGLAADAYHVNLRGEGKIVGAEWSLGERFKKWGLTYADPFLRGGLIFSVDVQGSSADRDLYRAKEAENRGRYDLERIGGRIGVGRSIGGARRLLLTYSYEEIKVGEYTPPVAPLNPEFPTEVQFAVGRKSLAYIGLDYGRRPSPEPKGTVPGLDLHATLELSAPEIGSTGTFLRAQSEVYQHVGTYRDQILSLGVRGGVVWGSEPFYERFYLDGPNQLRGFERRKIGPEGGEEFVLGEIIYSVPMGRQNRVYAFAESALVRRDLDNGITRRDHGGTFGIGVLLFNRIDISVGLGTGTVIVKSHRFGGINVGL